MTKQEFRIWLTGRDAMVNFWPSLKKVVSEMKFPTLLFADHLPGYMHRWWLFRGRWWCPYSIRIHHILREDHDCHLHDHPWTFLSLILKGWYQEETQVRRLNFFRRRQWNYLPWGVYHRIAEVSPGGCWTLVFLGPKRSSWGFRVNGQHLDWREHLGV